MALQPLIWNVPNITSERFDDEVVVVNFETGKYHSIRGDGVAVWQWLEAATSLEEVLDRAARSFDGEREVMEAAIRSFVDELVRERLAVPAAQVQAPAHASDLSSSDRRTFKTPALTTFSDMQELLWLDPIHEVDESGWPSVRNEPGH
jgi:hypothetical protein